VLRVGLTGGIASGKSHVLRRLAQRGLAVLDLDAVGHAVTAVGGAAYADVVAAFGPGILSGDGSIDRKALGERVFSDPQARERLNALVHPRVRAEELRRAAELERSGSAVLVSDAALLVEAGAHLRFERLVVVECTPEQQLARLVKRDGLTQAAARARLEAQMPAAEKRRFAHTVVDSSGIPAETDEAADALARELLLLAASPAASAPALRAEAVAGALVPGDGPGPRGLDGLSLLEHTLAADGLELVPLAQTLQPRPTSPWYRAARPGETAPWPESLSAALALWAVARGHDREWLAGAAAALCRLTHGEDTAIAGAVLAALAARAVAQGGPVAALSERLPAFTAEARRWGGAAAAPRVAAALAAAASAAGEPEAARRRAREAGGEPILAAALVALEQGRPLDSVAPAIARVARRLGAVPRT